MKQGLSLVFAASLLLTVSVQPLMAAPPEVLSDNKKQAVEDETPVEGTVSKSEYSTPPPEVETTNSTNQWLLYGGAAVLGVGIVAVAISELGSDSDGGGSSSFTSDLEPVGPSIGGNDWAGNLNITNEGFQGNEGVTAVITQDGESITISTSSTLTYGQYYSGHTSADGYLTVRDSATNKIWTTFKGNATTTLIQLYDYVNNNATFDTLFLAR